MSSSYMLSFFSFYQFVETRQHGPGFARQLKIFDFLVLQAKELLNVKRGPRKDFSHMTGFTGAIRYMAPEID
jgi:hypothetical protein